MGLAVMIVCGIIVNAVATRFQKEQPLLRPVKRSGCLTKFASGVHCDGRHSGRIFTATEASAIAVVYTFILSGWFTGK